MTLSEAQRLVGGRLTGRPESPFIASQSVLLRADHAAAYPVINGVPVLLGPEIMRVRAVNADLLDQRWAEAYAEMPFYNASSVPSNELVTALLKSAGGARFPCRNWLDAVYDAAAQLDAYNYIGDVRNKCVAQLGGKGIHAVKCLLAGASAAWLITPMYAEALFARKLAVLTDVADGLRTVVAVGEQLPFRACTFDSIYAGGCLHHMATKYAAPEICRVLTRDGRFAAVEPWQTTMHSIGTRLIGKREANSFCRPLDRTRMDPLRSAFTFVEVRHHGPILRYLALGLKKIIHLDLSINQSLLLSRIDDALPLPPQIGGSVAVLAGRT